MSSDYFGSLYGCLWKEKRIGASHEVVTGDPHPRSDSHTEGDSDTYAHTHADT